MLEGRIWSSCGTRSGGHDDDQPIFPGNFFQDSDWSLDDLEHFKEIGKGKDTIIYSAICRKMLEQLVAVKVYDKSKVSTTKLRAIKREIAMMMYFERLNVPNVVRFYGAFQNGNHYYIVMELCSGGDLLELLLRDKKFLSERRAAVHVMQPLLTTLASLHCRKIIHRDIKLENIFLDSYGKIRLGDFGLTMCMQQEAAISPVGTTEYMAPEVVSLPSVDEVTSGHIHTSSIKPTDEKVDVWALGVTLYELVTGRLPFEGRNKVEIKDSIREYRLSAFPSHVSTHCQSMIRSMLAYNPGERPSAQQLLQHPFMQSHCCSEIRMADFKKTVLCLDVRAGPLPTLPSRTPSAASYHGGSVLSTSSYRSLSPGNSMNLNSFQESSRELSLQNLNRTTAFNFENALSRETPLSSELIHSSSHASSPHHTNTQLARNRDCVCRRDLSHSGTAMTASTTSCPGVSPESRSPCGCSRGDVMKGTKTAKPISDVGKGSVRNVIRRLFSRHQSSPYLGE